MSAFKEHHPLCTECGTVCDYTWIPTVPHAVFKDSPTTGMFPGKSNSYNNYRQKRNEEMKRRQRDRYGDGPGNAIPNYQGKETGTWAEAQNEALKDKGKESAATFAPKVAQEKSGKIIV